jgi:predicted DNA-binding protein (UPF0251 family)
VPKKRRKRKTQKATNNDGAKTAAVSSKAIAAEVRAAVARQASDVEKRHRAAIAKAAVELDTTDASIIRLHLMYPTMTQEQIGDVIGLSRQAVNERMNAPKFKRAVEVAVRPALEIFESNKPAAARRLGELIQSPDHHIAVRASMAHMWSEIHRNDKGNSGADFIAFIQEAYERANPGGTKGNEETSAPAAASTAPGK